ncbi:MAG: hypothetical protein MH204_06195 [Fimbriimonadaceae bacterium]|nr:hypothetical protein [Fimbriimonadaceae bacterium]
MKRRTWFILGAIGLLVLICGLGSWGLGSLVRGTIYSMQIEVQEEGDLLLTTLGRSWTKEDLAFWASGDFLASVPDREHDAWLALRRDLLGDFKSGRSRVERVEGAKDRLGQDILTASYINEAEFEKGRFRVAIQFVQRKAGGWQMAAWAHEVMDR